MSGYPLRGGQRHTLRACCAATHRRTRRSVVAVAAVVGCIDLRCVLQHAVDYGIIDLDDAGARHVDQHRRRIDHDIGRRPVCATTLDRDARPADVDLNRVLRAVRAIWSARSTTSSVRVR